MTTIDHVNWTLGRYDISELDTELIPNRKSLTLSFPFTSCCVPNVINHTPTYRFLLIQFLSRDKKASMVLFEDRNDRF